LALARGDGRYAKLLRTLSRVDLLVLDDWGPEQLSADQHRDLLEIVEDRYDARSILITSQLPVDRWYEIISNPTLADAILDRIVHDAYRIELSGKRSNAPEWGHHGRSTSQAPPAQRRAQGRQGRYAPLPRWPAAHP
jgi:DNA replication protein DnaC